METGQDVKRPSGRRHIQIRRPQEETPQPASELAEPAQSRPAGDKTVHSQCITGLPDWDLLPPRGVVRRYRE